MHIDTTGLEAGPVAFDEPSSGSRAPGQSFRHVREFLDRYGTGRVRSTLAVFFGRSPLPPGSRKLFLAASGELAIADALWQLGPEWSICSSVPVSREAGTVDHVAIGPSGVFAISVHAHVSDVLWVSDNIMLVDGERVSHIRESEAAAVRTAQLLSDAVEERIEVTPCIVVVDPRSLTVSRPPRRVAIVTPRELRPWLKNLPRVLSNEQCDKLSRAANAATTWRDRPERAEGPELAVGLFRTLQADINQSRRIRLAWVTGSLILTWLVALSSVTGFDAAYLSR